MIETEVLVIGAGPAGQTLAIDLGQRGIRTTLIEKLDKHGIHPKLERANARTMEIFRRLGLSERIRAAGFPRDCPMDVFIVTSMTEPAVLHLPYASVAELQADIRAHNDGNRPLEPYQLISQYTLDPLLRAEAEVTANVDVCFGHEMLDFKQDGSGVTARIRRPDGEVQTVRAAYMVGCDGGASPVRKALGIQLAGRGRIRHMRAALFRADDLFERIPVGKGRHYHIIGDPDFTSITVQDSTRHFRMNTMYREGENVEEKFRRSVGKGLDFDCETLYTGEWYQHLLCADSLGHGRVFIAGDAAHLVIPTGGLGMNTAVGDVIDLSWKLAGTLRGWGGPELLQSYLTERLQIGRRNVQASTNAAEGRVDWRAAYKPDINDDTPEGRATRAEVARVADIEQRKTNEILGIEMGYRYIDTTIICQEPGEGPDPDSRAYTPTTWPGARIPHVWLDDGSALQDHMTQGYNLIKLGPKGGHDTRALEQALRAYGAPLAVHEFEDEAPLRIYGHALLLLRPDLHVAWRGNAPPDDPARVAAIATGHGDPAGAGGRSPACAAAVS
ncbi:FAD-dependent monooxygenase [Pigmentiphaga sp. YJ18]|uniref:FAD-dependent monooxygenase n=1 Tax=Pigmentiphaga sp. YJ18 TaxID=3134907 RepID=UPI00310CC917